MVRNNLMPTAAQRAAWNLYGANIVLTDVLGQQIKIPGFNHFIRSNISILTASLPQVDDGPTEFTLPGADPTAAAAISEATQQLSVTFDTGLDWVDEDDAGLSVYMALPKGAGKSFIEPTFRYAGTINGDSGTPPTSPQTISVPFAVTEDQQTLVQYRICRADGRVSAPFRETVTVGS